MKYAQAEHQVLLLVLKDNMLLLNLHLVHLVHPASVQHVYHVNLPDVNHVQPDII